MNNVIKKQTFTRLIGMLMTDNTYGFDATPAEAPLTLTS